MDILAQSPTVLLRRLSPDDLLAFQAYRTDPDIARYQGWSTMDDGQALDFLRGMQAAPFLDLGKWCQIGVADPQSGRLIGDMGLFQSACGTEVELGITLERAAQGKGRATQAMQMAITLIWTRSPALAIRTWCDQRNTAAVALMHRNGMTYLGTEQNGITEEAFVLQRPDRV